MSAELHVNSCPDASDLPACSSLENCSLSCLTLFVNHLEKCGRCVHHLVDEEGQNASLGGCKNTHCLRVKYCWQLRGDLIDCLYKCKIKVNTFNFDRIVKQLQVLFDLDFANILYQKKGTQIKRSEIMESPSTPNRSLAQSTENLFCFVDIFRTFKTNLESCDMTIGSGDLSGILQTLVQQLDEQRSDTLLR